MFTTLDVPDFVTPPLAMSNLVVTSVNTGGLPTGRAERLSSRLPVLPSTIREFRTADELTTFVEVYDNESRPHTIDITATSSTATARPSSAIRSSDRARSFRRTPEHFAMRQAFR